MNADDAAEVARTFHEAWNDPIPTRGTALIAEDCEFVDVPRGELQRGPAGYLADHRRWRRAFPDGSVEVTNVVASADQVVVEFLNRGTHLGPLSSAAGDFPATGRRIEVPYCSVMRVRDGKVVGGRDYYDVRTILRQLGVGS